MVSTSTNRAKIDLLNNAYYHVVLVAAVATMVLFRGIGLVLVNQSTTVYITAIVGDLSCKLGLLDGRTLLKLQIEITDDEPKLQCGGHCRRKGNAASDREVIQPLDFEAVKYFTYHILNHLWCKGVLS